MRRSMFGFTHSLLITMVVVAATAQCWAEVSFSKLHGSDLGLGVGARAIALGGAFVAVADDATAIYWNPAGLTQLKSSEFFISGDIPHGFSSAGLVYKPSFGILSDWNFAVGLGLVNRLSLKGDSGDEVWSGYPVHILYMAMIDLEGDFAGKIVSDTFDVRLSLAFSPPQWKKLSFGLNYVFID